MGSCTSTPDRPAKVVPERNDDNEARKNNKKPKIHHIVTVEAGLHQTAPQSSTKLTAKSAEAAAQSSQAFGHACSPDLQDASQPTTASMPSGASSAAAQAAHSNAAAAAQAASRADSSPSRATKPQTGATKQAISPQLSKSHVIASDDTVEPLVFDAKSRLYIPSRRKLPPTASMRIAAAGAANSGNPLDEARQELLRTQSKLEIVQDQDGRKIVNQYVLFEIVGRGSFGKVRRCVSIHSGSTYACKIMNKKRLKKKRMGRFSTALQTAQKEIAVWKKLRHPNVVSLHDVVDDPASDRLYLVSDFVNGGPLLKPTSDGTWEPLKRVWLSYFMFQLAEALAYLHSFGIAHRDIKPENILVHIESGDASEMRPWRSAVTMGDAPMLATLHDDEALSVGEDISSAPAVEADSSDDEAFASETPVLQLSPAEMHRIRGSKAGASAGAGLSSAASARSPLAQAVTSGRNSSARPGELEALLGVSLKLADFGLAQVFEGDDKTRSTAGTAAFTAPEMVTAEGRKAGFSARKADVWALGVTLYMCMFGSMPFKGGTLPELYASVQEVEPELPPTDWRGDVDSEGLDLLRHLLDKDPAARYTMSQVMQHAFVTSSGTLSRVNSSDSQQDVLVTDEDVQAAITPFAVRIRGLVRAKVATDAVLQKVRHRLHLAKAFTSSSDSDGAAALEHRAAAADGTLQESDDEAENSDSDEEVVHL